MAEEIAFFSDLVRKAFGSRDSSRSTRSNPCPPGITDTFWAEVGKTTSDGLPPDRNTLVPLLAVVFAVVKGFGGMQNVSERIEALIVSNIAGAPEVQAMVAEPDEDLYDDEEFDSE